MMIVDSGTVPPRVSSRSTGNFVSGQTCLSSLRKGSSNRSTIAGSNAIAFSWHAISTLWQYDESG
jgi:hypothetical protein